MPTEKKTGNLMSAWKWVAPCICLSLTCFSIVMSFSFMFDATGEMEQLRDRTSTAYFYTWQLSHGHWKLLETSTRAMEFWDTYGPQFDTQVASMNSKLAWFADQFDDLTAEGKTEEDAPILGIKTMIQEVGEEWAKRVADDKQAIDSSPCHQWETIDCSIAVPGVASNIDITIAADLGQSACDSLDDGRGLCEWRAGVRPDTVPDPQPPNLLNKCVCYACQTPFNVKGGLNNFPFPAEYTSTAKGTNAEYQCLNDPAFSSQCKWDGYSCTSKAVSPDYAKMNTASYKARFERIKELLKSARVKLLGDLTAV